MISLDEFNTLPEEEKKDVLLALKAEAGIKQIIETWGISRSKLYNIQNKLGISSDARKPRKPKEKKTRVTRSRIPRSVSKASNEANEEITPAEPNVELGVGENTTKFSLQLETTGPATLLVETMQMILMSDRVANLNLKVYIQIEEL